MKYQITTMVLLLTAATPLTSARDLTKRSKITCLEVGEVATARWTQRDGLECEMEEVVGVNYKDPPKVHNYRKTDDHNCMGRCGSGCKGISVGDGYTQDCFNHDMCGYFNDVDVDKKNGLKNKDCGDEFENAEWDFLYGHTKCKKKNGKNNLRHDPDIVPDHNPRCRHPGGEWFENDFGRDESE